MESVWGSIQLRFLPPAVARSGQGKSRKSAESLLRDPKGVYIQYAKLTPL